jgi:hypothetical protein
VLNKIDAAMCGDVLTACIGVSTSCVEGNVMNILFIERNICYLSQTVIYIYIYIYITTHPKLLFHERNYFLIICYCYDRLTIVTAAFLFPILTVICLLFRLRLPTCMQLPVFPLFLCTDVIPLFGKYSSCIILWKINDK